MRGSRWQQWRAKAATLFQDHEIFVRSGGNVRFLKVSAGWQRRVAWTVALVLASWIGVTGYMLVNQAVTANERAQLAREQAVVAQKQARVAKYQGKVEDIAADLSERQAHLEGVVEQFAPDATEASDTQTGSEAAAKPVSNVDMSKLPAEVRPLAAIEARQEAFAAKLLAAVEGRARKAEMAVAKLGLNPGAIVRNAQSGRGGPFIPYRGKMGRAQTLGPAFSQLDGALFRMEVLERTLVAIPSGQPANVLMMSSGFGYRSDPFTGAGAMHSGLDFRGPHGTPILAASPGRVIHAGAKAGYGNTIEIDHGQGMMTRYAHLSGFTARVGDTVAAGQQVGRMGSTGRSTGTHLHFEVRLNGTAVNPRRFLEANKDVLEIKADAGQRVGALARSR